MLDIEGGKSYHYKVTNQGIFDTAFVVDDDGDEQFVFDWEETTFGRSVYLSLSKEDAVILAKWILAQ